VLGWEIGVSTILCVHALKVCTFSESNSQQVLGEGLPCSSGSTSPGCTSDRNESGRDTPTQGLYGSRLPENHRPCYPFVIATERDSSLGLGLKPALGRTALEGSASGTGGVSVIQNANGGAAKDVRPLGRTFGDRRFVRRGERECAVHLDGIEVGEIVESGTEDGLANIPTIGVERKDIRIAECGRPQAWISFLGLVLDDERSVEHWCSNGLLPSLL